MGITKTPKYRIELTCISFVNKRKEKHSFAWDYKQDGKPSADAVKNFVRKMNQSIINGHNQHLQKLQSLYSNAFIVDQKTGTNKAEYIAPMFETID